MRAAFLFFVLAALLALPFALRERGGAPAAGGAPMDRLIIVSPHNEAIRLEFDAAFARWYVERTGRQVALDWRQIGGVSEINRYIEGAYIGSFRHHWETELGRPWSAEAQAGCLASWLPEDAPTAVRAARAAFMASDVGCGLDVFFGGGVYDFTRHARAGRLVPSGLAERRPEWFTEEVLPLRYLGDDYRDAEHRWHGAALSSFGIVVNRDALARLGRPLPTRWADLADPGYRGELALADPTKSGSMNKAFENVIQQVMHERVTARLSVARFADEAARQAAEQAAVAEGWTEGLGLLQRIAANARYFTDSAQRVPIDVAAGNCAAGMCIDFYARQQVEALSRRGGTARVAYISPEGGTVFSVDPIGLLRGAPHAETARWFIEFVLSPEGQALWDQRADTPGGPTRFALRRLPVRRDAYADAARAALRSDPDARPYELADALEYRAERTARLFGELRFILRVMAIDTQPELQAAWRELVRAGFPPAATAKFSELQKVDYAAALGPIKEALGHPDKTVELSLARELAAHFRAQYAEAAELARADR
jgi:iron(III) transport system substrate-binding protein